MGKILKCRNCKYSWEYNGKSKYYTSCPRCYRLVKTEEVQKA